MSQFPISVSKKYNLVSFSTTELSLQFEPHSASIQHGIVRLCSQIPQSWVLLFPWGFVLKAEHRSSIQVSPISLFPLLPRCLSSSKAPMIKSIYENLTANIVLNSERHNAFSLRSAARERCPFLLLLLNTVPEVPVRASSQENEIKSIQIEKEKVKQSVFADDVISHIENPNKSVKNYQS